MGFLPESYMVRFIEFIGEVVAGHWLILYFRSHIPEKTVRDLVFQLVIYYDKI